MLLKANREPESPTESIFADRSSKHKVIPQVKKGTIFWKQGQKQSPEVCFLLYKSGSIALKTPARYRWPVKTLQEGHFIGDFPSILAGKPVESEAECLEDCEVLQVLSADLEQFLRKNPGLKLLIREEYIIY